MIGRALSGRAIHYKPSPRLKSGCGLSATIPHAIRNGSTNKALAIAAEILLNKGFVCGKRLQRKARPLA
jgi:hypothetical protein